MPSPHPASRSASWSGDVAPMWTSISAFPSPTSNSCIGPELSEQPFGRLIACQDHGHSQGATRIDIRDHVAPRPHEVEVRRSDHGQIRERDGSNTVHPEGTSAGTRVREEIPDPGLGGHAERVDGPGGHARAPGVRQPDAHSLDDRALEYIKVGRSPWRGSTPIRRIEDDRVRGRRRVIAKRLGQRPCQLA